jgi:hypothetical protein
MKGTTTITADTDILERARKLNLNISAISQQAILEAVEKSEGKAVEVADKYADLPKEFRFFDKFGKEQIWSVPSIISELKNYALNGREYPMKAMREKLLSQFSDAVVTQIFSVAEKEASEERESFKNGGAVTPEVIK